MSFAGATSMLTVYVIFDMDRLSVATVRSTPERAEAWIADQPLREQPNFVVLAFQVDDELI